jgi:hypothetical protein
MNLFPSAKALPYLALLALASLAFTLAGSIARR